MEANNFYDNPISKIRQVWKCKRTQNRLKNEKRSNFAGFQGAII